MNVISHLQSITTDQSIRFNRAYASTLSQKLIRKLQIGNISEIEFNFELKFWSDYFELLFFLSAFNSSFRVVLVTSRRMWRKWQRLWPIEIGITIFTECNIMSCCRWADSCTWTKLAGRFWTALIREGKGRCEIRFDEVVESQGGLCSVWSCSGRLLRLHGQRWCVAMVTRRNVGVVTWAQRVLNRRVISQNATKIEWQLFAVQIGRAVTKMQEINNLIIFEDDLPAKQLSAWKPIANSIPFNAIHRFHLVNWFSCSFCMQKCAASHSPQRNSLVLSANSVTSYFIIFTIGCPVIILLIAFISFVIYTLRLIRFASANLHEQIFACPKNVSSRTQHIMLMLRLVSRAEIHFKSISHVILVFDFDAKSFAGQVDEPLMTDEFISCSHRSYLN